MRHKNIWGFLWIGFQVVAGLGTVAWMFDLGSRIYTERTVDRVSPGEILLTIICVIVLIGIIWNVARERKSESQELEPNVPILNAPDTDAWSVVNYILDETDFGVGKQWQDVVRALRFAAVDSAHPFLISGHKPFGMQEDIVPPDAFQNHLEIGLGGDSWVGSKASMPEMFRHVEDKHAYEGLKFCMGQIESRWPRSKSRKTDKLTQRQLIRGFYWLVEHAEAVSRRYQYQTGLLPSIVFDYPIWLKLKDHLEDEGTVLRQDMTAGQVANWLRANIQRLEREWGVSN